jgi:hypothetical protein
MHGHQSQIFGMLSKKSRTMIMGANGLSGISGSGGPWSTNGLSGDLSSSHTGIGLGIFGGRNGPLAMVDEEEMSLAFLLPRLVSEDVAESGGLSSPDPEDCVAMNEKGRIRIEFSMLSRRRTHG